MIVVVPSDNIQFTVGHVIVYAAPFVNWINNSLYSPVSAQFVTDRVKSPPTVKVAILPSSISISVLEDIEPKAWVASDVSLKTVFP